MEVKPILEIKPSLLKRFDCNEEELNNYLKRFAKKNDKLGIGRTYLLQEKDQILGYYTISMAQIEFEDLPALSQSRLPRYPIPAVRIGRLAIDKHHQGRGLGEYLLMDALNKALRVSEEIAVFSVIVDAKSDRAKNFYLKYGFIPFRDQELSLFLPIQSLRKA